MSIQGDAFGSTAKVTLSPAVLEVFDPARYPRGSVSYRALFGGRGSGKSYSAALVAALWGYVERLRVLCVREYQNSIAQSFYAELKAAIEAHWWLSEHYDVHRDKIVGANGTEFIFKGLHANPTAIKSLAKIDLTIIEEAEDIPEESWLQLEATVLRQPKSEIWPLWNPRKKGSPVDVRFRQHPPKDAIVRQINYDDNPFFPDGLKKLCERQREILDYATWAHVWLGAYLENSASQIFNGRFEQKEFTPGEDWDGPYQGGDWGYSQDPTAMVRAWIHDECLWIEYEAGGVGIELDDVPRVAASIPDFAKFECRWDSAQPAMISHVKAKGLRRSVPADKGKGSVEDGIQFIRSFRRVYIHPRCKETLEEFRSYSWKVDRLSGQILDKPVDAFNHYCIAEGQLVMTDRGNVPIEEVTTSDRVMTRDGWRRVLAAEVTGYNKPVVEVATTLGNLICTHDHPIYSGGLFVRADALSYGDEVMGDESVGHVLTVKERGTANRVYNLKVEGKPEFIASGLLVHNCDALRYALEPVMKRSRSTMTLKAILGDKR